MQVIDWHTQVWITPKRNKGVRKAGQERYRREGRVGIQAILILLGAGVPIMSELVSPQDMLQVIAKGPPCDIKAL